jgi:predicted NACHT family NTPase
VESILPALTRAIASVAAPVSLKLMERSEAVIRLRKNFDLDHEHLPDNFGTVYAYTLVEYGIGKEEPLLQLFYRMKLKKLSARNLSKINFQCLKMRLKNQ